MSVLATLDLISGDWTFNVAPETPSPDLEIGFKEGNGPVAQFNRLSFGFTVVANGLLVLANTYPPEGVEYSATDQAYITNDRVDLAADDEVVLAVWAENGGQRHEGQTTFAVPRPEQPYPSWTWQDGAWAPPAPYPVGDGFYTWDEGAQEWAPIEIKEP